MKSPSVITAALAIAILAPSAAQAANATLCKASFLRMAGAADALGGYRARYDAAQAKGEAATLSFVRTVRIEAASLAAGLRFESSIIPTVCDRKTIANMQPSVDGMIEALDGLGNAASQVVAGPAHIEMLPLGVGP